MADASPEMVQPIGPTGHLDTVEWWKEQYTLAIEVGQAKIDAIRNVHRRRSFPKLQPDLCVEDRQKWPCATIVALDNAGTGQGQKMRARTVAAGRSGQHPSGTESDG